MVTRETVRQNAIQAAAGYVAGFLALLAWSGRVTANQDVVLLSGMGVALVVALIVGTVLFRRSLRAQLWGLRPLRYSWPNFILPLAAMMIVYAFRASTVADWGFVAYAVALPIVTAGFLSADWLWARGEEAREHLRHSG